MIGVSMGDEHRIDVRQAVQRNTGLADPWKQSAQGWVEIGVGKKCLSPDLN